MDGKIGAVVDLNDGNFYSTLCAWLVGENFDVSLKGSKEQIEALTEAYASTMNFHNAVVGGNSQLSEIMRLLGEKHVAAQKFERLFDVSWPL
jgi:hypothetical protein